MSFRNRAKFQINIGFGCFKPEQISIFQNVPLSLTFRVQYFVYAMKQIFNWFSAFSICLHINGGFLSESGFILQVCFSCVSVWILLRSLVTLHWTQTAYLTRNHVVHLFNKKRTASYFPNHYSPCPQSWKCPVCPSRLVLFFLHLGLWPLHQTLVLWLLVGFWDGKHDRVEDGERIGLGISLLQTRSLLIGLGVTQVSYTTPL